VQRWLENASGTPAHASPADEVINDEVNIWFVNTKETGRPALTRAQMPPPSGKALLHFRFPNIWQNRLTEKMSVFIAFAPIDDQNSMLYIRNYQRMVRFPLLRTFVDLFAKWGDGVIAHQDRRIVETQRPYESSYRSDEQLFAADQPIVYYRKMRSELQQATVHDSGRSRPGVPLE
jgi:phenylpropionate dioxygenase-like ring-hydroxylating dioxygenase large terminal subunit